MGNYCNSRAFMQLHENNGINVNNNSTTTIFKNPKDARPTPTIIYNVFDIILKLPTGTNCFTCSNNDKKWTYQQDVNSALKSLYNNFEFTHWIVYNDETPTKTNSTSAHAKGILAWNNDTITWLIHSVPKFPSEFNGTSNFPDINHSELEYGQSFIFIKLNVLCLHNILIQLFTMHPNVYISNYDFTSYSHLHTTTKSRTYTINEYMHHVAKSPMYHEDLYETILIPKFGGNCYTETWVRGHQCLDNNLCKMIDNINWDLVDSSNPHKYNYKKDHSKYCFSDNSSWVMIGDLNRMTTQFKRGGGGLVICDEEINSLFKSFCIIK